MMSSALLVRNRNYRLLFSAGALTNLGDGLIVLALPWLATLMTRDPVAIGLVAAATRLPWLLFALPAGVIIDRSDQRKLIARADILRAAIVLAILLLAVNVPSQGAIWLLASLAFLLGSAEVLRDNAAQTILPAIVDKKDLEAAKGQLWSTEQQTAQFIGPRIKENLSFVDAHLAKSSWFAGETLSGADIQMSFPLEAAATRVDMSRYGAIESYIERIHGREAYQRALERGGPYDYAGGR